MAQHWLFSGSLEEGESSSPSVSRRRPIVVVNPSTDVGIRKRWSGPASWPASDSRSGTSTGMDTGFGARQMSERDEYQRREDLTATSESLKEDSRRLFELEDEKQDLDIDDPQL